MAQLPDSGRTHERIDHIERDVMLLQRQLARGGGAAAGGDMNLPAGGSAQLEVRLSAIEEQLRQLLGRIEENDNRTQKLADSFTKLQRDTEFRFNELTAAAPPAAASTPPVATELAGSRKFLADPPPPDKPAENKAKPGAGKEDIRNFSTPRELYNYAFRLLNQTQYEDAAAAFDAFTKKYPKDPLVGNAYYWKGEAYYIRHDHVNAADNFRQGFEALPEGPKAADNLLKLAMSLNALGREKEACVVLQQVVGKFKKTAVSAADKAEQEQKRIGCKK